MNKFRVIIEVETYSADPEEWVIDAIGDNLEEDESIRYCNVQRVEEFTAG